MDRRPPPAVRKELLLARAAVERVELRDAMRDLRGARDRFSAIAGVFSLVPSGRSGLTGALLGGLSMLRRHPYLGSAASIAIGATRRTRAGRWLRRAALIAAVTAGAVWLAGRSRTVPPPAFPKQGPDESGASGGAASSAARPMQGSPASSAGSQVHR